MKYLAIIFSVLVSACATTEEKIITSHELVYKKVPSELLEIAPAPDLPNLDGTQKDVSIWLVESEKRVKTLESQIQKIKEYLSEKPTTVKE